MPECPFYEIEEKILESREIRADRQQDFRVLSIPWCSQPKHSPADKKLALNVIGKALTCDGEFAKCPLTPEQRGDV